MSRLVRLAYRIAKVYWFIVRPVTLGVRVILISNGQVLLVRHTYQDAWYLPGGGVKRGETLEKAIRREAVEECGAEIGELSFLGVYTDFSDYKNDHIAVFIADEFSLSINHNYEIAGVASFPMDDLPTDINPGSQHRIAAFINDNNKPTGLW
jgi:ADP-ribose pyrophosphatase YjhB (NUDIX family)